MSRIGKLPITVPAGVEVKVDENNTVTVKGPKGTLTQEVNPAITLKQEGNILTLERPSDAKPHKAMHGLYRSLVHNMVVGVTDGFSKTLELVGTGYRAQAEGGKKLTINIGFSHPVILDAPENIQFETPNQTTIVARASTSSRLAILPPISAPSVSRNPIWARASSTLTSISAARKARPVSNRKGNERKCLRREIVIRIAKSVMPVFGKRLAAPRKCRVCACIAA